jgi:hypothetical protein
VSESLGAAGGPAHLGLSTGDAIDLLAEGLPTLT